MGASWWMLILVAHAQEPATPAPESTPLCAQLLDELKAGGQPAAVAGRLEGQDVYRKDVLCLVAAGAPKAVVDAGRARVQARRLAAGVNGPVEAEAEQAPTPAGAAAAAPSPEPAATSAARPPPDEVAAALDVLKRTAATAQSTPIDILVFVRNPREVAVAEKGEAMVTIGQLAAAFGAMAPVEDQVYDEIVNRTVASFAKEGIAADVTHGHVQLRGGTGRVWNKGKEQSVALSAGNYQIMRIRVLDPVAVAVADKGDVLIGAALLTGTVDVAAEVRTQVEQRVFQQLRANGVDAVILGE